MQFLKFRENLIFKKSINNYALIEVHKLLNEELLELHLKMRKKKCIIHAWYLES